MKAEQTDATFRKSTSIRCAIAASPARIFALLTDGPNVPRWNRTVSRQDGEVALGKQLAIEVLASPGRTFKPKVTRLERDGSTPTMEWSGGLAPMFKGVRTFRLTPCPDGSTEFEMTEVFTGVMLPLIRKSLPDFGPIFEAYAEDLKRAAEKDA